MNQWIRFFQALVKAGLSPYQAEWVVRKATSSPLVPVAHRVESGDFKIALVNGCVWAEIPNNVYPFTDFADVFAAI